MLRNEQEASDEIKIPDEFLCPVTKLIFLEPVIVYPSKKVYEKEVIQALRQIAHQNNFQLICPLTRIPIKDFEDASDVKSAVHVFITKNPNVSNQKYVREKAEEEYKIQKPQIKNDSDQIDSDAALARELLRRELDELQRQIQLELQAERERQSQAAYRQQLMREQQAKEKPKSVVTLSLADKLVRDILVEDVQNLIWALGFEKGPKPKGSIDNFALLFFAFIEQALLQPLPWQKIKVNTGPKYNVEMYAVLKEAIRALKEENPTILENATSKKEYTKKYDAVKTWFGGELSLSHSDWAVFAQNIGTIKNQPGEHISRLLNRVEKFLHDKCKKEVGNEAGAKEAHAATFTQQKK